MPLAGELVERPQQQRSRLPPRLLSDDEQQWYVEALLKGSAPAGICRELSVTYASVQRTLVESPDFQRELDEVLSLLNLNVETALYHAAMKGSIPAQALWLKNRPPPHWPDAGQHTADPFGFGQLADEELLDLARTQGVTPPPDFERGVAG